MARYLLLISLLLACDGATRSSAPTEARDEEPSRAKSAKATTSAQASAREETAPTSALPSATASAAASTKKLSIEGVTVDVPTALEPLPREMIDGIIASAVQPQDKDSKFEVAGVGKPGTDAPLVLLMRTLEPRPSPTVTTVRAEITRSIELSKVRMGDELKPLHDELAWKDDAGEWCTVRSDGVRSVRACSLCWIPDASHVQCAAVMCASQARDTACAPLVASRVLTPTTRLPLDKALGALPAAR